MFSAYKQDPQWFYFTFRRSSCFGFKIHATVMKKGQRAMTESLLAVLVSNAQ